MKNAVIELWKAGLTSGQIAEELRITRNQVAGFVWRAQRDGLIPKRLAAKKPKPKPKPKIKRTAKVTVAKIVMPVVIEDKPEPLPPSQDVGYGTKTIMDLKADDCRWIYDNKLYCGRPTEDFLHPWCPQHRAIVYAKKPESAQKKKPFSFN